MMPASVINLEAEQALLGACLSNADVLDAIEGKVTALDFSEPVHVQIFDAFTRARTEGRRIDVTLVKAVLGLDANAQIAEGLTTGQYLARLMANVPTIINAPDYARVVSETASYRRLVIAADDLRSRAVLGVISGTPASLAAEAIGAIDVVAASNPHSRRLMATEAAGMAAEAAEDRLLHGVEQGVGWGLVDLDHVTKLYPGELTICAARPSMGKTTLGLHTAFAAAKAGEGVAFFSLEMNGIALGQRILSDMCFGKDPIPYTNIRDGRIDAGGLERLKNAAAHLGVLPLLIEQEAGLTVGQISARARTARQRLEKMGRSLGLIVVDHLGLISATDRYAGSRHLELGAMTTALRSLAKELGVPVLLLCQLSRAVEGRENKRPMLSDLRESGRIEEDADAVILLYREAYYLERAKETSVEKETERLDRLRNCATVLEVNVAKQRQGATRTVELFVSMPNNAVRNVVRGY